MNDAIVSAFWRGVCAERAEARQQHADELMAWTRGHGADWDHYRERARRERREAAQLRAWAGAS